MAIVTQVRFDEENSPVGVWYSATLSIFLSTAVGILQHLHYASQPTSQNTMPGWYQFVKITNIFCLLVIFISTLYVIMGAIWHPIPGGYQGDITSLKLDTNNTPIPEADFKLLDLDSAFQEKDDPLVSESDLEVRDHIQWLKMLKVLACLTVASVTFWRVFV
ncbi:MAG TPA: hypothetical protein VNU94_05615 [Acidobacteriaceae bacterium]|jgi:hypothetical protein|nr:hypothetical protein [Acidobacteriaceae bacterium]